VTVIKAGPCWVTGIKTQEADGYEAVQLGYEETSERKLTGGQKGHLGKSGGRLLRHLKEFRLQEPVALEHGTEVKVDIYEKGEFIDVTGVSRGKGFAGAVKKYGFAGGPKTHGQSDRHRAPGSRGAGTTPGRTFKGARGPGHMGDQKTTVLNLRVAYVDADRDLLAVRGAVPGAPGSLVSVRSAVKKG
jgi:large subunit ribosomal protein L3